VARSDVTRAIGELAANVDKACAIAGVEVAAALVEATPVRTGWARANWIPSVGKPAEGPVGTPETVDVAEQERVAGIRALRNFRVKLGSIFISNHVPYIVYLDEGSSDQAPAGFVNQATDEGLARAQTKIAGLK
jgi:hypothetical protein